MSLEDPNYIVSKFVLINLKRQWSVFHGMHGKLQEIPIQLSEKLWQVRRDIHEGGSIWN